MRIGIVGASGYVGSALHNYCNQQGYRCITFSRQATIDAPTLIGQLQQSGVEYVINCAGYTGKPNVDACEIHKAECLYGNAVLPGIIRDACKTIGITWGHVSSGCIYTGRRRDGNGFTEEDPPNFSFRQNNCSFYSGTKAMGEEVLGFGPDRQRDDSQPADCYVWRLRIPFESSTNPRNYLQKLLTYERLLDAENSLSLLPEFTAALIDTFRLKLPCGIYNLTNPGSITTREVVDLILQVGVTKKAFRFFRDESEFMRVAAKTPRSNCVLDASKAVTNGLKLTPVREAIQKTLENWPSQEIKSR